MNKILSLLRAVAIMLISLFAPAAHAATGNVGSYEALQAAVGAGGSGDVILSSSFSIVELPMSSGNLPALTIGRSLTLDLNGHALSIGRDLSGKTHNVIQLASGVTLTIIDSSEAGTGKLSVSNNHTSSEQDAGCAINTTNGTLIIKSGTVEATAKGYGAAIGGSVGSVTGGAGGTIIISGGIVKATASGPGAAIGGGMGYANGGAGGNITISGGMVTATATGDGAAIGGGYGNANDGGAGGTITISGGTVEATASGIGAAIGGGVGYATGGAGGTITISGANTAVGAHVTAGIGAGIGGGASAGTGGAGGTVVITEAQVTANGYANLGADIGGGVGNAARGSGGTLEIDGGANLSLAQNGTDANVTGRIGVCTIWDNKNTLSGTYSALTMTGGTASSANAQAANWKSGIFKSWTVVMVTARFALPEQVFINWSATPAVTFVNANSQATAFTMPTNALAVTAVFGKHASSVAVTSAGGADTITADSGTLQMSAAIQPADATIKTVTWSVTNGTGMATISADGLLTAVGNGTVTVRATANDGSGVFGECVITISGSPNVFDLKQGTITIERGTGAGTVKVTCGASATDNIPQAEQIVIIGNIMANTPAAAKTVVVQGGVTANVTLRNVSIFLEPTFTHACAFEIKGGSTVNLTLVGNNRLESNANRAGLEVSSGNSVVISGSGSLWADGGSHGAGIGGGENQSGGNITINGGTITANGATTGAGIGGGQRGAGGNILICGENTVVTAKRDLDSGTQQDIGAAGNVFVALPAGNLTLSSTPFPAPNTVAFTASPASIGTVTATLPAPFNAAGAIAIVSSPGTTAKNLSVLTTFTTTSVSFALAGYDNSPLAKTGTQLMATGATVAFTYTSPPPPPPSVTPEATDFTVGNLTQTEGETAAVTITPNSGKSAGTITIYYEGIGDTFSEKGTTPPTAPGTYLVTFDVADDAENNFAAVNGLEAGTLVISAAGGGHTHTPDDVWHSNATHHWHECTAGDGAKSDEAEHVAGDWEIDAYATETEDGSRHKECETCGYVMEIETIEATGTGHEHVYDDVWCSDATSHWHECTALDGARDAVGAHVAGDWIIDKYASETEDGARHKECVDCGYVMETETLTANDDDPEDPDVPEDPDDPADPYAPVVETPVIVERGATVMPEQRLRAQRWIDAIRGISPSDENPNYDDIIVGSNVTFGVNAEAADENDTLTYQWYRNGEAVAGETSATFVAVGFQPDDVIAVEVTNAAGGVTYREAAPIAAEKFFYPVAFVSEPPAEVELPEDASGVELSVVVSGSGTIYYQWCRYNPANGELTAIPFANSPTYLATEPGHYCLATNNRANRMATSNPTEVK